jgi:hypothetical protein
MGRAKGVITETESLGYDTFARELGCTLLESDVVAIVAIDGDGHAHGLGVAAVAEAVSPHARPAARDGRAVRPGVPPRATGPGGPSYFKKPS